MKGDQFINWIAGNFTRSDFSKKQYIFFFFKWHRLFSKKNELVPVAVFQMVSSFFQNDLKYYFQFIQHKVFLQISTWISTFWTVKNLDFHTFWKSYMKVVIPSSGCREKNMFFSTPHDEFCISRHDIWGEGTWDRYL